MNHHIMSLKLNIYSCSNRKSDVVHLKLCCWEHYWRAAAILETGQRERRCWEGLYASSAF